MEREYMSLQTKDEAKEDAKEKATNKETAEASTSDVEKADVSTSQLTLSERNSDYIGWIRIDGAHMSYLMVQGSDNEKYLPLPLR